MALRAENTKNTMHPTRQDHFVFAPIKCIHNWAPYLMMVRVSRCDDQKQLVFGTLDNEPLNDYEGQVELGSELAVSYSQIREHRKPTEFTKQ